MLSLQQKSRLGMLHTVIDIATCIDLAYRSLSISARVNSAVDQTNRLEWRCHLIDRGDVAATWSSFVDRTNSRSAIDRRKLSEFIGDDVRTFVSVHRNLNRRRV